MDERFYSGEDSSIELYESKDDRDKRLHYLNGGLEESYFTDRDDDYYAAFEINTNTPVDNEPYKKPEPRELLPGELESRLRIMATFMNHPLSK